MQHPIRLIAALIALGIATAACSAEPTEPETQSAESDTQNPAAGEGVPIQVREIGEARPFSIYSGVREPARMVIRTAAEWEELWSQVTGNVLPRPATPAVNFTTEMVVVAAMGTKPSGGYSIEVEEVRSAGGALTATVHQRSPGPGCFVTAALTAPIAMVVVQRSDDALGTEEKTTTFNCN